MTHQKFSLALATAVAASIAMSAGAQNQQQRGEQRNQQQMQKQQKQQNQQNRQGRQGQKNDDAEVIALSTWEYEPLYREGWTADALMDAEVFGPGGEEIGSVENLLINQDGEIVAVVAQVGGFWDIGDTHVAVPWNQVSIDDEWDVTIPITEETAEDYSLFKDEYYSKADVGVTQQVSDTLDTGPRIWKATDLLNDYVLLENGDEYGYVTDLVFDKGGDLLSVVTSPSAGYDGDYGNYAYPWYGFGYGWTPASAYYTLPYTAAEVDGLTAFNYEHVNDVW